jgi:predicted transcriptional regulator of viral defense system
MQSLKQFIYDCAIQGRAFFSREDAMANLALKPETLSAAISRLIRRNELANPRHGFYLILRPEDRIAGAPDPARWIDPLMKYQRIDYRISLLRAAAIHGASHQSAMVFQVITPKQLRNIEIGRHRLQFIYQAPKAFMLINQPSYLDEMKSDTGFAKLAGVELTLLDCARYLHKASGINSVAQIVKDIGASVNLRKLAAAAAVYENSTVRRLGYLLEQTGHERQAKVLAPFVRRAKSPVLLNPGLKTTIALLDEPAQKNRKWQLLINEDIEVDF